MQIRTSSNPHIRTSAHSHIFLLGMMGAGKTYWAQQLADNLNIDWMDLDAQVEKNTSMTIKEIFEINGEEYFRTKEQHALHQLAQLKNIIIATGGGTPCFHNNMQWMNKHGITIWIDEPIETLVNRLAPQKTHRPLLNNLSNKDLHNFLATKLHERKKFYNKAKHRLSGTEISLKNFLKIIQPDA